MVAVAKKDELPTPSRMAALALGKAKGDVQKATRALAAQVRSDDKLYRAVMDSLVDTACYDLVASVCRAQRRKIWSPPAPPAGQSDDRARVVALGRGTVASLLDFPLPGGMKLRDAKRSDVVSAHEFYATQARDMDGKARWLRLIAQSVPEDRRVGDVLTADRLESLQQEALK